jgi:hypothetical protein
MRELKPYAEPIALDQLTKGLVCFAVRFVDDEMLVPEMTALVYVGKNLDEGDTESYSFQDFGSFKDGDDFDSPSERIIRFKYSVDGLNGIYDFEHALEVLLRCSLRRNKGA